LPPKSTLGASVNLDLIEFGDVSLGSFGIGGQVKAFDLKLPTQGGFGLEEKKLEESLKSSFNLGYLDGSLYITLSTRVPLRGERKWDWDKDTFKFTIYDWKGKSTSDELIERSQTHQL
jgi:hypothetical protein